MVQWTKERRAEAREAIMIKPALSLIDAAIIAMTITVIAPDLWRLVGPEWFGPGADRGAVILLTGSTVLHFCGTIVRRHAR